MENILEQLENLAPVRDTICNECPWRRVALPGFLGPFSAREWIEKAHSQYDQPIECHKTITGDRWDDKPLRQCLGAAIYRRNVGWLPKYFDKVYVAPFTDTETIFGTPGEFLEHHGH